jgi:hypothetical protein
MQPLFQRVAGHTSHFPKRVDNWGATPPLCSPGRPVFILDIVMQDEAVANKGSGLRPSGAMTSDFGGGLGRIRRCRPSQPLSLASVNGQKTVMGPPL